MRIAVPLGSEAGVAEEDVHVLIQLLLDQREPDPRSPTPVRRPHLPRLGGGGQHVVAWRGRRAHLGEAQDVLDRVAGRSMQSVIMGEKGLHFVCGGWIGG